MEETIATLSNAETVRQLANLKINSPKRCVGVAARPRDRECRLRLT
jgi:hypothetical protein